MPIDATPQINIRHLSVVALLAIHAKIGEELHRRRITSTANVTGGYAEYLFCKALGLKPVANSHAHIDAIAPNGSRYQIKARRLTLRNQSRELGVLHDLPGEHFDWLAGVLFDEAYRIEGALLVTHQLVLERAKRIRDTNYWKFRLTNDVFRCKGMVRDVTEQLRAAAEDLATPPLADLGS